MKFGHVTSLTLFTEDIMINLYLLVTPLPLLHRSPHLASAGTVVMWVVQLGVLAVTRCRRAVSVCLDGRRFARIANEGESENFETAPEAQILMPPLTA
jgi:hypothetical protein